MDQLDQQRERVQDDLRGLIAGDVRCDPLFLQLFATDGSIYEIPPLGVVRPRSTADVVACVAYAAEQGIPIHPRGAGTGVAGGCLGPGLIVDFSRYMRRIIYADDDVVRVQAGVTLERLNAHLETRGRVFGPEPTTSRVTTIGGMIGVNASGSRWLRYGAVRRHVLELKVALADGQLLRVGRESLGGGVLAHAPHNLDLARHEALSTDPKNGEAAALLKKSRLVSQLAVLLERNASLLEGSKHSCPSEPGGYRLSGLRSSDHLDLAQLFVGAEGTLGLVTEATLATQELARYRGMALLFFSSLENASRAIMEILPEHPAACDLMDRRHLSLAREGEVRYDVLIPAEAEAALLVEYMGDKPREIHAQIQDVVDRIWHTRHLAFGARQAFDADDTALFWGLSRRARIGSYPMQGATRPVPIVEDISVAPERLPDFLVRMQDVLKRHQLTTSLFCHAGQGRLHIRPLIDVSNRDEVRRMFATAEDLYKEVLSARGTIGGANGCGLSRAPFLKEQIGPLYAVFRQVKGLLDPNEILNPNKLAGPTIPRTSRELAQLLRPSPRIREAEPPSSNLPPTESQDLSERAQPAAEQLSQVADKSTTTETKTRDEQPEMRDIVELQIDWAPSRVAQAASSCTRCGECRTRSPDVRMCPIFRVRVGEESSPRAKANLISGVLAGQIELASLGSEEFKAMADLCVHCHACRLECPVETDIPRLMQQGKGAYVSANGLSLADWVMTHLDLIASLGTSFSSVANWVLGNRQMRWLMEKTMGIAQGRKLPRLTSRSFLRRAARKKLARDSRRGGWKVAYFVDTYANYFDPTLASAAVAVLAHNGAAVYVPPRQKHSGMTSLACGALDHARRLAHYNTRTLAEAVRQGYHVVTTEPAAAVCLTQEYPSLIDDDDAHLVAENSSELCSYLWKMHMTGRLQLDLRPLNASLGYHLPCHIKTLQVGAPGENLLRLIPALNVTRLEEGCSAMAGTFGIKKTNYRSSLRAGRGLINRLRDPGIQAGTTECSACKFQMEQGTTKPTIHPIKLLALAYGLMPELSTLLKTRGEERLVT